MTSSRTMHNVGELAAAERSSGLVLAGFLAAGNPPTLVPILVRPGRSAIELGRLMERLSGENDADDRASRRRE
jgi:hypothetical protein